MIAAALELASKDGLPPLGGRLLAAYRVLWAALAATALGVLCWSLVEPSAHPVVTALRLAKGALVIVIAAILLRRRPGDPVAALLALAFLTWTISSSVDFSASGALAPMLLDRLRYLLFVLALLLFPDGRWAPAWTRQAALASAAVFVIGIVETAGLVSTSLFLPLAIGCVLAAIASLIARFRAASEERVRQQLRWVALGLVVGIALILSARLGARSGIDALAIAWEAMFQLGILVIALGFLVSLLRYRLYDADSAISRSAAYAALTIAMVATFAGTEAAIEWFGQQYLGMGIGDVSAAMAAAVVAVLLNPVNDRLNQWAENRFQRDLVALKRDLPELVADLATTASPSALASAALAHICAAVHSTRAALISGTELVAVEGASREEVENGSDRALFPIRLEIGCAFCAEPAALLLGPRPDGSLPGRDDIDSLTAIGPALRHALASASARETDQALARDAHRSARRRIEKLEARMDRIESGGRWMPREDSNLN